MAKYDRKPMVCEGCGSGRENESGPLGWLWSPRTPFYTPNFKSRRPGQKNRNAVLCRVCSQRFSELQGPELKEEELAIERFDKELRDRKQAVRQRFEDAWEELLKPTEE